VSEGAQGVCYWKCVGLFKHGHLDRFALLQLLALRGCPCPLHHGLRFKAFAWNVLCDTGSYTSCSGGRVRESWHSCCYMHEHQGSMKGGHSICWRDTDGACHFPYTHGIINTFELPYTASHYYMSVERHLSGLMY